MFKCLTCKCLLSSQKLFLRSIPLTSQVRKGRKQSGGRSVKGLMPNAEERHFLANVKIDSSTAYCPTMKQKKCPFQLFCFKSSSCNIKEVLKLSFTNHRNLKLKLRVARERSVKNTQCREKSAKS